MKKTEVDLVAQELTDSEFKKTEKYKYYLCCEIIRVGKEVLALAGHDIPITYKIN